MAPLPPCHRLLHCVVLTLAAGYALHQVHDCVSRYLTEPVSSQEDSFYTAQIPTPAITLCNHIFDGWTMKYLMRKTSDKHLANLLWDEHGNDTIPNLLRYAAVDTDDALGSCLLRDQPCAAVGSWSRRLHSSAGDCFTFTPNTSDPIQVGSGYDVTFFLPRSVYNEIIDSMYVLKDDQFLEVRYDQGNLRLSVYVHDIGEPFSALPWIQPQEPVDVEPGVQAEVRIAMEVTERVSQRHLPCEPRPDYSRTRCAFLCHAAAAAASTGLDCRVTDMPTAAPLCGSFANYSALQRAFTTAAGAQPAMEPCHKQCPRPCRQRSYRASLQKSYGLDERELRRFSVRLFYAGEETRQYREQWSYGASALVGEAGGVVGLMLGLSVLSVFEAAQQVADDILRRVSAAVDVAWK